MSLSTLIRRGLVAALLMSLGWSLRGQFGHLKGALIPGALAAVIVVSSYPALRNRKAIAWALLLSPLGFSIGGHLSYGKTILAVLLAPSLSAAPAEFFRIFLMGAAWGGLGLTFLGFALSEGGPQKRDLAVLAGVAFSWFLFLGIFNLEDYDLALFLWGLVLIHIYNGIVKKSAVVTVFGIAGGLGFGLSFLLAVLLLYAGKNGLLGGGWPWWALRDQIIGILGGLVLFAAPALIPRWKFAASSKKNPSAVERWGLISYFVLVPFPNAVNVLTHWALERSLFSKPLLGLAMGALVIFSVWKVFSIARLKSDFPTLLLSTLFFIWSLSLLAIAKEVVPLGIGRWEAAYTLFLAYSLVLTVLLLQEKRIFAKETTPPAGSGA